VESCVVALGGMNSQKGILEKEEIDTLAGEWEKFTGNKHEGRTTSPQGLGKARKGGSKEGTRVEHGVTVYIAFSEEKRKAGSARREGGVRRQKGDESAFEETFLTEGDDREKNI